MKSISFVLAIMMIGFVSCKTTKPAAETGSPVVLPADQPVQHVNYSDASTWILGYFKVGRLSQEPHSEWFIKGMDEYSYNPQSVDTLKGINKEGLSVKIVLGTWCPDSRREVPRFMRVLQGIGFPADKVSLIGVDNMKISPIDNYEALGIERVPTFIFYKNNIEAGRIIENPVTSLEQDMVNILTRSEKH
jgi:thiol-disulfide isomerase/thioredoxin